MINKIKEIVITYAQVFIVVLAFGSMVFLSYVFMRSIEYKNLQREANNTLRNICKPI